MTKVWVDDKDWELVWIGHEVPGWGEHHRRAAGLSLVRTFVAVE